MSTVGLIHVGTPKAGSTTLQENLFSWRSYLIKASILIPEINGRRLDQKTTRELLRGNLSLPRVRNAYEEIRRSVDKLAPRYIVFSSEYMADDEASAQNAKRVLSEVCDEVEVILYLREPAAFYLSSIQQGLKATDSLTSPVTWRAKYKEMVSLWRGGYGERLKVVPFQTSTFPEGLSRNFLDRFADFKSSGIELPQEVRSNSSEFAEVTFIMQRYFSQCYPAEPRRFRPEATLIREKLEEIARSSALGSRPRLRSSVEDLIISNHAEDLKWLKREEMLTFDALDYEAIDAVSDRLNRSEKKSSAPNRYTSFSDIATVDTKTSEELLMKLSRCLAEKTLTCDDVAINLRRAKDEISRLTENLRSAEEVAKESRADLRRAKAESSRLTENLRSAEEVAKESRADLRRAKDEISRLTENLRSAEEVAKESRADLRKVQRGLDRAQEDIKARRSKVAAYIDWLDYRVHFILGELPFASKKFRARMMSSASKRRRRCYDA